jgi:hypothetical protein
MDVDILQKENHQLLKDNGKFLAIIVELKEELGEKDKQLKACNDKRIAIANALLEAKQELEALKNANAGDTARGTQAQVQPVSRPAERAGDNGKLDGQENGQKKCRSSVRKVPTGYKRGQKLVEIPIIEWVNGKREVVRKEKVPFIEEDSKEYEQMLINEAVGFCPGISPCKNCGAPTISGYRCNRCDPS